MVLSLCIHLCSSAPPALTLQKPCICGTKERKWQLTTGICTGDAVCLLWCGNLRKMDCMKQNSSSEIKSDAYIRILCSPFLIAVYKQPASFAYQDHMNPVNARPPPPPPPPSPIRSSFRSILILMQRYWITPELTARVWTSFPWEIILCPFHSKLIFMGTWNLFFIHQISRFLFISCFSIIINK